MSSTYTPNLHLRKPENMDLETEDIWGTVINDNFDKRKSVV